MVKETIVLVSDALKAGLQNRLDALDLSTSIVVEQFLNPFEDDEVSPINYPAVVVNLVPMRSPSASFAVSEMLNAQIPVVVEYRTRDLDTSESRSQVSAVQRAIIHVLNDLAIQQGTMHNLQLIEIANMSFDFVKFDGSYTGGAILFHVMMRDLSV